MSTGFLPFDEALPVAQSLGLGSMREWLAWSRSGARPTTLPSDPARTYKEAGWQGWGHWLGTGNTRGNGGAAGSPNAFLPFAEALPVAQSLGLESMRAWLVWSRSGARPANMPSDPPRTYKGAGWQGWRHWLGNADFRRKEFLPFAEALAVARSTQLTSSTKWHAWSKAGLRPPDVPAAPSVAYKGDGWRGWGHWLGTGNQQPQKKRFLPFAEALRAARACRLASEVEWRAWCKSGTCPPNLPSSPNAIYRGDGWRGWRHWLGTDSASVRAELVAPPLADSEALSAAAAQPARPNGRGRGRAAHHRAGARAEPVPAHASPSPPPLSPPPPPPQPPRPPRRHGKASTGRGAQTGSSCRMTRCSPSPAASNSAACGPGWCGPRAAPGPPTCPPTRPAPTRAPGGRGGATGSAPATSNAARSTFFRSTMRR